MPDLRFSHGDTGARNISLLRKSLSFLFPLAQCLRERLFLCGYRYFCSGAVSRPAAMQYRLASDRRIIALPATAGPAMKPSLN